MMRHSPKILGAALFSFVACDPGMVEVDSLQRGLLTEVTAFGSNPGGLKMYKYVPANVPANAPLVLALHACTQTAASYENAGWNQMADQYGFYVLYPEQQTGNNALTCFNWAGEYGDPTNLQRGEGENQSIIQMIDQMKSDHDIDAARVFASGHSGGAAQVALMLAVWPDVFAGGAMIAGVPFNCTTTFTEVTTCTMSGLDKTPAEWANLVNAAYPAFAGTYPKVSIWHGTSDTVVGTRNFTEMMEQWTETHGIDRTADVEDTVDGFPHKEYQDAGGITRVETYELTGMGHGTPVDPNDSCGQSGSYFLDVGICSARHIAQYFGLDGGGPPPDTEAPQVDVTAPTNGTQVTGTVSVEVTASDNVAVTKVEIYIGGSLVDTLTAAPFNHSWPAGSASNGTYTIKAIACDAAGNCTTDDDTSVTVQGGVVDTTPPTVNITAPTDSSEVSGSVTITAVATDDFGVTRVAFFVDGNAIGEVTSTPFTITWDASVVAHGSHALAAKAYDAANNEGVDNDTSVTVPEQTTGDTTPPTVNITSPASGDTITGLITVTVDAQDETGMNSVLLFLDDEHIGTDYRPPYEFLWDSAVYPEDIYTLKARAFDLSGNFAVDEDTTITVIHPDPNQNPDDELGDPIPMGKRRWGCNAAPAPVEAASLLILFAGVVLLLRRSR